jgi:arylformamidase
MLKIHDVTRDIDEGMIIYPGDPGVRLKRVKRIEDGNSANISEYTLGSHTGTHVDPPFHFEPDGCKADDLPLDSMIGPAVVILCLEVIIDRPFLEAAGIKGVKRVLFKTKNSDRVKDRVWSDEFAHLTPDAAVYLVSIGLRLVGTDCLSIERFHSPDHAVHRSLLKAGVVIVEGLDLSGVGPGQYQMACLPLKIKGGDGAPARVVLMETI